MFILLLLAVIPIRSYALSENILLTEVFKIVLEPTLFNWTYEETGHQYVYQPSLLNAPDLPIWIKFLYSNKHHVGYLYGVPPKQFTSKVPLQIVALNRKSYETRHGNIEIQISEKLNPAKFEVHMKIDNLNVDDIFNVEKMDQLKDIFRKQLWKDSENDLYVTFLASATEMGARKPLNPSEGEGVVLRLGSQAPISVELSELQDEIKPLWKLPVCPRDFKRTSVERTFRDAGFALDWCSFRLIDENSSALHQSEMKEVHHKDSLANVWESIEKEQLPMRNYAYELTLVLTLPIVCFLLLALVLSFILCFYHDGMVRGLIENNGNDSIQYVAIQKATQSLRNFSNSNDANLSPDLMLISQSPTSTIGKGVHCRPSPPPYMRPKFQQEF